MIQSSAAQSRSAPRHAELLRRRRVTGATLIVGTLLLCATLRVPHGSTWFTVLGFLVAATWIGAAFLSGPIRVRPAAPLAIGRVGARLPWSRSWPTSCSSSPISWPNDYPFCRARSTASSTRPTGIDRARARDRAGERRRRGTLLPRCAIRCRPAACSRREHDRRLRIGDRVHPQPRARGSRRSSWARSSPSSAAPPAASSHRSSPT